MDRMSSIEMALMNEKTEMAYYQNESSRSKNPLAKSMFESLAKDEKEHMIRIENLHKKLVSNGSWPSDLPIKVKGTNIQKVLGALLKKQSSADHDQNDEQAIEKAIAFESKGEAFYRDLGAACENPMEKKFFVFLSEIEREHHLSLVDTLAYLKDPKSWMERHERAGLDGA
jgi:rubrerythrin